MNKELIITYFEEFEHWLKGGEILCCKTGSLKHTWGPVEKHDKNPIEEGYIYAINDKYAEFRKALAEDKTVQVDVNYCAFPETDVKNYKDLPKDFTSWKKYEVSCYRIKPEEPKFKVGDWIKFYNTNTLIGKIINFNSNNIPMVKQGNDTIMPDTFDLCIWQPQPDDYAWFYDYEKYTPTFGKFMQIENGKYLAEIADGKGSLHLVAFTYCEPFLGTLPTFLKPE